MLTFYKMVEIPIFPVDYLPPVPADSDEVSHHMEKPALQATKVASSWQPGRNWGSQVSVNSVIKSYPTLRPHGLQHARLSCPSPTPRVHSNSCPLSRWCHPTLSSSVVPFSFHLQSFPASGSFPMSQLFTSVGQSIGVSASTSVLPMNTQDWSPLGWTGWISLQSKGLSRVFSNTTAQKHQFSGAQLSLKSNSHVHTRLLEKTLESTLTAWRSNQSFLKEVSLECSLEGLLLKLKLQYFGQLMWRADSSGKTLMLGKIEGRRRRGQQRMRRLDGITNSINLKISKIRGGVF